MTLVVSFTLIAQVTLIQQTNLASDYLYEEEYQHLSDDLW